MAPDPITTSVGEEPHPDSKEGRSVLVKNLKFETSPAKVRRIFEKFGAVRDVYLPLDYYTKKPRGFGFVEFMSERDAISAVQGVNRTLVEGNEVIVVMAQDRRKTPETMRAMTYDRSKSRRHDHIDYNRESGHYGSPEGYHGYSYHHRSSRYDERGRDDCRGGGNSSRNYSFESYSRRRSRSPRDTRRENYSRERSSRYYSDNYHDHGKYGRHKRSISPVIGGGNRRRTSYDTHIKDHTPYHSVSSTTYTGYHNSKELSQHQLSERSNNPIHGHYRRSHSSPHDHYVQRINHLDPKDIDDHGHTSTSVPHCEAAAYDDSIVRHNNKTNDLRQNSRGDFSIENDTQCYTHHSNLQETIITDSSHPTRYNTSSLNHSTTTTTMLSGDKIIERQDQHHLTHNKSQDKCSRGRLVLSPASSSSPSSSASSSPIGRHTKQVSTRHHHDHLQTSHEGLLLEHDNVTNDTIQTRRLRTKKQFLNQQTQDHVKTTQTGLYDDKHTLQDSNYLYKRDDVQHRDRRDLTHDKRSVYPLSTTQQQHHRNSRSSSVPNTTDTSTTTTNIDNYGAHSPHYSKTHKIGLVNNNNKPSGSSGSSGSLEKDMMYQDTTTYNHRSRNHVDYSLQDDIKNDMTRQYDN